MKDPLVSVVIPAYNPGELIRETLDSVLSQSFSDYEVIVVDDGSTDNTAQIVKSYRDSRIKYHYQANSGLPAKPRNTGARLARGAYIAFLDHDDVWLPQKLEHQMRVIQGDRNIALISTNAYFIYGNARTNISMIKEIRKSGYLNDDNYFRGNKIIQSTAMVKRSVFESLGGFNEAKDLKAIEDYDLWLRIYANYPCYYIADCLAYYRRSNSSTYGSDLKSAMREYDHFIKYFPGYGFSESANKKRLSYVLARLAWIQLKEGDRSWVTNLLRSFNADRDPIGIVRFLISLMPYYLSTMLGRIKRIYAK